MRQRHCGLSRGAKNWTVACLTRPLPHCLGDDKDVAAAFRKRNKQERQTQGQTSLDLSADVEAEVNKVVAAYKLFEGMPERTPAEIEAKQRRFQEAMQADAYRLNQVAAIPIAQFYIPKTSATKDQLITDATYRSYWTKGRQLLGPCTCHGLGHRRTQALLPLVHRVPGGDGPGRLRLHSGEPSISAAVNIPLRLW